MSRSHLLEHSLFTTHVVFLQRLDSSPLDLCCFSLHLCRLSPILNLLFRSLSLSRLIVSPLLMLLSLLDFSSVIHMTWSSSVTCDMHPRPPPGLLGTSDNLAGERVQKTHGSLCQMQQGGLADVTEHVHGSFHLPERPGKSSDENA